MSSQPESSAAADLTPAQRIALEHGKYHSAAVEDTPDESDAPAPAAAPAPIPAVNGSANGIPLSEKAAGKQRMQDPAADGAPPRKPAAPVLNTNSEEAFPSLGPAKPAVPAAAGMWGTNAAGKPKLNGAANASPKDPASRPSARPAVQLPLAHTESYPLLTSSVKTGLKKSLAETLNDVTRGTGVKIEARQGLNEKSEPILRLTATGSNNNAVRKVLREAILEVGKRETIKVPIPVSSKAQLIGKGGSKIKEIQTRSGARIQLPPASASSGLPGPADDDEMIEATVEGDPIALASAIQEIRATVGQGPTEVRLSMQNIPPELYPFLNSHPSVKQSGPGMKVKVPHYRSWSAKPPAAKASDFTPQDGLHINLTGPSEQARAIRAELEAYATELQEQLEIDELLGIERERHQFILGASGMTLDDFINETGCSVILPPAGDDTETIHIVGPRARLEQAKDRAIDLAGTMVNNPIDISRSYNGPKDSQTSYMEDLARYMDHRGVLDAITNQHNAQVSFPTNPTQPWTLWTRDSRSGVRARTDVLNAVSGHPHTRFRPTTIHPFYQRDLVRQHGRQLREQYGVHMVPPASDDSDRVLLVFESLEPRESYSFPQRRPDDAEIARFAEALLKAEEYLLEAIGAQETIVNRSVDAPAKYREKLARFTARQDPESKYPVEYRGLNETVPRGGNYPVVIRGPTSAVDDSVEKFMAFIEEQIRDEAERDHVTSCPFPKAFRGRLIGKDGETINKIRDDFDVEINFKAEDDRVEIRGPPAKAELAKAHIVAMAKKAEDETTHSLIIPAKFHGELIGKGGSQVQKFQERYGVQVFFPLAQDDASSKASGNNRRAAQGPNEVIIKGSRKGADACKDDLWALYTHAQDNSFSATVSVAQAQVPALIGRDGSEARILRSDTGADIDFPKQSDSANGRSDIVIKGTKEAVQKAKKLLEERVKAFDQTVTEELVVDKKFYRTLIGANGENLRQLVIAAGGDASQSSRIVQIPREASTDKTIKVIGTKDVVEKLAKSIKSFVETQESRTTETIEVPPERHGALIGARGSVKKNIESEYNVNLLIPQATVQGPARAQVKIIGQPADVEKVKEHIASLLRQGAAGETVLVPTRLHHAVADNGRFFQSLRRDLKVTVDHKKQQPPPKAAPAMRVAPTAAMPLITDDASVNGSVASLDVANNLHWEIVANAAPASDEDATIPWALKGNADDVAKAKIRIENAMAAAGQSVTGFLVLPEPRSTHGHVVGPGGATIRKIRETTGCNPKVPPSGEVGAIELVGTAESVEEAKDMIVKAVEDGLRRGSRREQRGVY